MQGGVCDVNKKNGNDFECKKENEQNAGATTTNDTNDICKQLLPGQADNQNVNLELEKILEHEQVKTKKSSVKLKITLPQTGNENSEILKLCYEVAEPEKERKEEEPEQEQTEGQKQEQTEDQEEGSDGENNLRMLKIEGNNPPAIILPKAVGGLNQKFKDSLIMAI